MHLIIDKPEEGENFIQRSNWHICYQYQKLNLVNPNESLNS